MEKMVKTLSVLWIMAVCLTACNSRAEQWLDMAEACMEVNPDSAYDCLSHLAAMDDMAEGERARYALLRTQAMHKCRMPLGSDSLINVAVDYFKGSNDRHRLALSLLYKGLVHKECGEVERATEAFVASEQAFEGVEDDQYKALLFNHYASLLMKQDLLEESLAYYKKTCQYELKGDSLHYVVSTYGQIANLFELMGMRDSARIYYERGLSYTDKMAVRKSNYYLLLHDYATFLMGENDYASAERLLLECAGELASSVYRYTSHAALAALYYKKGELDQALTYGRLVIGSDDSLMVCGGYLLLYKIYKGMGEIDSAYFCHNQYRSYHSDIAARRRTAEVAVIPHKMKSIELTEDKRVLSDWLLWLATILTAGGLLTLFAYRIMKERHYSEQTNKEKELAESQNSLAATEQTLLETRINLGQLKGILTRHVNATHRMEMEHRMMLDGHREEIDRLNESIAQLKAEIGHMKDKDRAVRQSENDLKQTIKGLEKELQVKITQQEKTECQWKIDQRIEHFMMEGKDAVAVDLLLQLRLGKERMSRFDILPSEYQPLLMRLLEQEAPALHEKLDNSGLEWKKKTMCCLMALGLDDEEMMARASCLAPNSVKKYHKECRQLVDSWIA